MTTEEAKKIAENYINGLSPWSDLTEKALDLLERELGDDFEPWVMAT